MDCPEIWFAVRDQLARRFKQAKGGMHPPVQCPLPYLGNGWMDCAENLCVKRPIVYRFTKKN